MIKIKDRVIKISFQLAGFFLLAQLIVLIIFWQQLPPQVPLFYSRPWGQEQLVSPWGLSTLPLASLAIILANLVIASFIPLEEKPLGQLLIAMTAVFSFLCLFTLLKIIFLVI